MIKYNKKLVIITGIIIGFFSLLSVNSVSAEEVPGEDQFIIARIIDDGIISKAELDEINAHRKPFVDNKFKNDKNYNFSQHRIDDIMFNSEGNIYLSCNNGNHRTICYMTVGCPPTVSIDCDHTTWKCEWTTCPIITPRVNCKNTCKQKYICTSTITKGSCPATTIGSNDTKEEIVNLTQKGCEYECGTADGVLFPYNATGWGSKTFCNKGVLAPINPKFPSVGGKTSWTCSYASNVVECNAYRGQNIVAYCGDGKVDPGEDCDDGDRINTNACPNNCKLTGIPTPLSYCGDGKIQKPNSYGKIEECDDGNNVNGDGCSTECKIEKNPPIINGLGYCGDGVVQKPNKAGVFEDCDDGNTIDNDACSNTCKSPIKVNPGEKGHCGDGIVQTPNYLGFNEECDDGNKNNDDACSNICTKPHTSQPDATDLMQSGIYANSTCDLSGSGYANGIDTNIIYMRIKADPLVYGGKEVINLGIPTDFKDLSNNLSDRVNKSGESSLKFEGIEAKWNGDDAYIAIAKVSSVTPFTSCENKLSFKLGGSTIVLNDVGYNFKKPFVGELKATNDNGTSWEGDISLGTEIKYKLSALPKSTLKDYSIGLNLRDITHNGTGIILQGTALLPYTGNGFYNFTTRINSDVFAEKLTQNPGVQVTLPTISYILNGKSVKYYLSEFDYGNDETPIKMQGSTFIGIKIIGGLQGAGKYEFTGQGKNLSNLYPSEMRTEVRKKAYDYIKSMKSGQILNNVRFVEGNVTISGNQDYETLVVKNGNVIINGDLNVADKKFGIIVLKDGYDINTSYNTEGNVYVTPEVKKLNAIIYADGGFISARSNGIPYITDSSERTNALQNQLFMNGSLFTRNTIGGSQYVGGYYTLPGGSKTGDFDKSMLYDLNYLRRGNYGCEDKNLDGDCKDSNLGEIREGFVIRYDPKMLTNPPKLFSK